LKILEIEEAVRKADRVKLRDEKLQKEKEKRAQEEFKSEKFFQNLSKSKSKFQ
jgi:hypothetical protein